MFHLSAFFCTVLFALALHCVLIKDSFLVFPHIDNNVSVLPFRFTLTRYYCHKTLALSASLGLKPGNMSLSEPDAI